MGTARVIPPRARARERGSTTSIPSQNIAEGGAQLEAARRLGGPLEVPPGFGSEGCLLLLELEDAVGLAAPLVGGVGQIPLEGVDRVAFLPLERTVRPSAIWRRPWASELQDGPGAGVGINRDYRRLQTHSGSAA